MSQNVVGYHTITISQGWNLLGINWQAVGGTSVSFDELCSIVPVHDDTIYVSTDSGGWDAYTYYYGGESDPDNGWWADEQGAPVLNTGSVLWYQRIGATAENVSFAGQVDMSAPVQNLSAGWNLVSMKVPKPFNPALVTWTGLTSDDAIYVATAGGGWDAYTYYYGGESDPDNGWWGDDQITADSAPIADLDTVMWIKTANAATLKQ